MAETGVFPLFDKLANIFRIPDLRKRVLFTLAMLAVYRLGGHLPTPGVNFLKLEEAFNQKRGIASRFRGFVFRRQPAPNDHLCPGHHALHHGIDYPAAFDRGV